ncbi:3-succinoylsemialdehyde-pyridine dehydrogenase [Candidatus Terasakiella magnetica]|nr:3-succinoylsemialdehyde-pyridine dehydrogenase [Candidatus Terasakiella magnetica]
MRTCQEFYIDGKWVAPVGAAKTFEVINPATEAVSGLVALGGAEDADRAILAAARAFPSYSALALADRLDLLKAIISVYERRIEEMADAITEEMGAPYERLSKPAQAAAGLGHFKVARGLAKSYAFEKSLGTTLLVKEPVGVCAMITPWNWPANQIACKVAPALAVGCTMVLKPSEFAPYSAKLMAEILHEAGVPAGVFNMIFGDGAEVGPVLSSHPLVDMVSLTGSTQAGISVSRAAAATVKRVSLELGGKSANILCDSADFKRAVTGAVRGLMGNTGQSCNAPSRLLVPNSRLDEVEGLAAAACAAQVVGDPRDATTTMGPLSNARQFAKVQSMIEQGVAEGAKLVAGGPGRPEGLDKGYFTKPTVFSRVNDAMTIVREEVFGPVLVIRGYDSLDEAIASANDTVYGLSGYVTSGDLDEARAVARRLRTGNVHLNGAGPDFNAPFGGYKQSGNGREWGEAGLDEFVETKAIMGHDPAPKG